MKSFIDNRDLPEPEITLSATDRMIEWVAWLILAATWIFALYNYPSLPDDVPMHFNAAGEPDSYGDKNTFLLLPLISTILLIGMTWLNRRPQIFNYPVPITEQNAQRQYRIATQLIRYLKLTVTIIFLLILLKIKQTAMGTSDGLGVWFLPAILALTFFPIVVFFFQAFRKKP